MTKRSWSERATERSPLGSAVLVKSRFERYLASFREPTGYRTPERAGRFRSGALTGQRRFDRVEERADAERCVVDRAVHEEPGGTAHAAAKASIDILTHALQVDVVADFSRVARHVEPDLLGVVVQVARLEVLLVGEDHVVHLPELALRGRAFGGFGGEEG